MKKLSYFAKSQIFLWSSVAVSVLDIFVAFPLLSTIWGVLFGIGCYYWGKEVATREAERKHNIELFGPITQRMW